MAWKSDYRNPDVDAHNDQAIRMVADRLALPPGSSLLNVGSGFPDHAVRFARLGYDVTGVDDSDVALDGMRDALAGAAGPPVRLQHVDLDSLPFEDATFDVVFAWGALSHARDLDARLGEFARLARPGGFLVLCENDCDSFDVRTVETAVRLAKRLARKPIAARQWSDRGVEDWEALHGREQGHSPAVVRRSRLCYLDARLSEQGLSRIHAFSEQWTELYTRLPWRWSKRLVYRLNRFVLRRGVLSLGAIGAILIYRRSQP